MTLAQGCAMAHYRKVSWVNIFAKKWSSNIVEIQRRRNSEKECVAPRQPASQLLLALSGIIIIVFSSQEER